jgi:ubiquinone/menaquinone biosynthesis C-methylase UbiE
MTTPAETYEEFMVPVLFKPLADHLLTLAAPTTGERIVDVGCGTGIVARTAAADLGPETTVIGVDVAPPMLDVARQMSAREDVSIDWREGAAESLPVSDESVDLVLSQAALMFFTDPLQALHEMRRILKSNGRIAVSVFGPIEQHPFYAALHELLETELGNSGVADIFSLGDPQLLQNLLTQARFRDIDLTPIEVTANFGPPASFIRGEIEVDTASIPAMQHLDEARRADLREMIQAQMKEPLDEVTVDDEVIITFHAHIFRGVC